MWFGGVGMQSYAKETKRDYKKTPTPFLKKFIRKSQSSTPEREPKKGKNISIYGIIVSTPQWLMQLTKKNVFLVISYISSLQ